MMIWLITDKQLSTAGDLGGVRAARRLPIGATVYLRSPELTAKQKRRLLQQLQRIARSRRLRIALATAPTQARRYGADIVHLRRDHRSHLAHRAAQARLAHRLGLRVVTPVHNLREALHARTIGADYWLISPIYATASHPQVTAIGSNGFARLAKYKPQAKRNGAVLALGGLTKQRAQNLRRRVRTPHNNSIGWTAISAWAQETGQR